MEAGSDTPSGPAWTATAPATTEARSLKPSRGRGAGPGRPQHPPPAVIPMGLRARQGQRGVQGAQGGPGPPVGQGDTRGLGGHGWGAARGAAGSGAHLSTSPDRYLSATLRMRLWTWLKLTSRNCACRSSSSSFSLVLAWVWSTHAAGPARAFWRARGRPPEAYFLRHHVQEGVEHLVGDGDHTLHHPCDTGVSAGPPTPPAAPPAPYRHPCDTGASAGASAPPAAPGHSHQ